MLASVVLGLEWALTSQVAGPLLSASGAKTRMLVSNKLPGDADAGWSGDPRLENYCLKHFELTFLFYKAQSTLRDTVTQSWVPPKCPGVGEARGHGSGRQHGRMELAPEWGSGAQDALEPLCPCALEYFLSARHGLLLHP